MTNVLVAQHVGPKPVESTTDDGVHDQQSIENQEESEAPLFSDLLGSAIDEQTAEVTTPPIASIDGAPEAATVGHAFGLFEGNQLPLLPRQPVAGGFSGGLIGASGIGEGEAIPWAFGVMSASAATSRLSAAVSPHSLSVANVSMDVNVAVDLVDHSQYGETMMMQRMAERQLQSVELGDGLAKTIATGGEVPGVMVTDAKSFSKTESPLVAPSTQPRPSVAIDVPLHDARWRAEFNQRVAWMVKEGMPQAEIRLNPPHLGPVDIKISMTDDQTSVTFVAQHQSVRDVIEAALPRLREMLNQNGMQLADAAVADQSSGRQQGDAQRHWRDYDSSTTDEPGLHEQIAEVRVGGVGDNGSVDYYV